MQMNQLLFQTEKVEDCRSGVQQVISNIEVCNSVGKLLAPTLGPFGLDKLFYGRKLLVTNDGATILENMDFKHPVAQLLSSLSKSQDREVGDGTTSVILLSSEVLRQLIPYIRDKYPLAQLRGILREIKRLCLNHLSDLLIDYSEYALQRLAETSLNSKSIRNEKSHFARLIIEGLSISGGDDLHIIKIPGGALLDSVLVEGIAFEKTFTYAGYEQQPKKILNPKICALNVELEWKSEKENAEIRVNSVSEYQKVVDAEWSIITEKLDDIIQAGANVVLSSQPIGDYATQYFARKGLFSAGRVHNLNEIVKAFGGRISSSTKYIELGECDLFEERQLGKARYNYFESKKARARTFIIRGPGNEALEEVDRAVHDAVCVVRTALSKKNVVCGGGSVEMQLSKLCRDESFRVEPEKLFIFSAISKAFEKIPAQLAENFGLDPVLILQRLRKAHSAGLYAGVSLKDVEDMREAGVIEPLEVKRNMVESAFNLAEAILMIDSTILAQK